MLRPTSTLASIIIAVSICCERSGTDQTADSTAAAYQKVVHTLFEGLCASRYFSGISIGMEEAKASAFSPDLFKHICYFVDRAVIPRGRKTRFARTHKGGEQSDLENLSTRSMSAGGDESAFRSGPWSSVKSLEKDVFRSAMSSLFRSVFCPAQTGDRQR